MPIFSTSVRCLTAAQRIAGLAVLAFASLSAAETPAALPPVPAGPPPATAASAPLSPAAQAFLERIRELRPNLGDEDEPTRTKALETLRSETAAMLEALFRVPTEEDTADQRKLLTLIANDLQAKIAFEQFLLKIPAAQRAAVDDMLKKVPGFGAYFNAPTDTRIALLDTLVKAKPDAVLLAAFLSTVLVEKDPKLVMAALEFAAANPSTTYLPVLGDLIKAGYVELYLPKDAAANQMQMFMVARNSGGEYIAWSIALVKLISAIPGEQADAMLVSFFANLTSGNQAQINLQLGNRSGGNNLVIDVANALVQRSIQSAFPTLVKAAQSRSLLESGMMINNQPVQYSSGADFMVYTAYRLIDKTIPEQTTGQTGAIKWKNNEERLKFFDDFLAAWQGDVKNKKPQRDGLEEYQRWYDLNRRQLIQALDANKKQR